MQVDKLTHASVSALIVIASNIILPLWLSIVVVMFIGVSKEVYDKFSEQGCADWRDLVADAVGISIGALIAWLHC